METSCSAYLREVLLRGALDGPLEIEQIHDDVEMNDFYAEEDGEYVKPLEPIQVSLTRLPT